MTKPLETISTDFFSKYKVRQNGELYSIPELNKKDLTISQFLDIVFEYIKTGKIN